MKDKSLILVEELYTNNLKEYGITSTSVGWPNPEDHRLRFDKLLGSFDLKTPFSLNDLGCGYGAVLNYFNENRLPVEHYYGYDISQEMLDSLVPSNYSDIIIERFCSPNLSTCADFSIASGIFNVKFEESEEDWLKHILQTLSCLNEFSSRGFSFNLLTSYVDFKRDHLYYGDPLFFFDYCKKNFSNYVTLLHDYKLWEWTVVVKKEVLK